MPAPRFFSIRWIPLALAAYAPTLICLGICVSLSACASKPSDRQFGSDAPDEGNPNPAVYGSDTFNVRKWQTRRPSSNSIFYGIHCSVRDGRTYYSKTSYDCSQM